MLVETPPDEEGEPLGPRVNDDHDLDTPAQAGEIDEGGFEPERRVRGGYRGQHRRVAVGPIDFPGVATGSAAPGVRAGIQQVTGIRIAIGAILILLALFGTVGW